MDEEKQKTSQNRAINAKVPYSEIKRINMKRRAFLKLLGITIAITTIPVKIQAKKIRKALIINEDKIIPAKDYLSNIASMKGLCRLPDEEDEAFRKRLIQRYIIKE